jgi:hypothetical protein
MKKEKITKGLRSKIENLSHFEDGPYLYTIRQFAEKSEKERTVAVKALNGLHEEGFLLKGKIPKYPGDKIEALYYYGLTEAGKKFLGIYRKKMNPFYQSEKHSFKLEVDENRIRHELGITQSLLTYKKLINNKEGASIIKMDFAAILEDRERNIIIKPDLLIKSMQVDLDNSGDERFYTYFIEFDAGSMKRWMLEEKIQKYWVLCSQKVVFFVINDKRKIEIENLIENMKTEDKNLELHNPGLNFAVKALEIL